MTDSEIELDASASHIDYSTSPARCSGTCDIRYVYLFNLFTHGTNRRR